ncbi:MAG TPA: T9SS type A sorting domain-containing protein [Adhaeribacter sp.]|nr:T9SS type A sorting domain-containing protein [Adhaeribacter sp.]
MKKLLLVVFALATGLELKAQTYAPITLTGFNHDVVANGAGSALTSTTSDVDGVQFTFMAQNFINPSSQSPTTALPNSGTINSVATSGLTFQLAPFTGNNSLRISGTGTGTLTFSTPRTADQVYVLATSGSGASSVTITVNFSDATSQTFTQTVGDWYNGTGFAIQGISRVNRTNNVIENSATNPRLYQYLLNFSAANAGKTVQSIAFNKTSTAGVLNVMGITIRAVASSLPNDVGVTAITGPNSGCSLTSQETVSVTVTNFGTAAQSNIPVSYTLNGGPAVNEVMAGPLPANATLTYNFNTKADLSATGNYAFTATTSLAADGSASNDLFSKAITVAAPPAAPTLTLNGPATFCPGSTSLLTAASSTSGVTYQWLLNGAPITGATSPNYAASQAGNYTVVANTNGCSSSPSAATTLSMAAAPAVPLITPGGPTSFCSGGSVTLTAATITPGATFSWLRNGSTISGATTAGYTAVTPGNYSVMALSGGCNSPASQAVPVTISATPATPSISQNGGTLTSSSGIGNQWFLNGTAIAGATGQSYTTAANGAYTVMVTAGNCSSAVSAPVNVLNTGIRADQAGLNFRVYPNPGTGLFKLDLPEGTNLKITVSDLTGKVILTQTGTPALTQLDLRKAAKGIYLLRITAEQGSAVRKLVVE